LLLGVASLRFPQTALLPVLPLSVASLLSPKLEVWLPLLPLLSLPSVAHFHQLESQVLLPPLLLLLLRAVNFQLHNLPG